MGKPDIDIAITMTIIIIYMFLFDILYGENQPNEFKKFLEKSGLDGNKYKLQPNKLLRFIFIKERKIREKYRSMVRKGWFYFVVGIIFILASGLSISYLVRTFMKLYEVSSND